MTRMLLLQAVDAYNRDGNVHGILVQLPMPSHINEQLVLDSIAAEKDVDGFSPANIGKLAMRGREPNFVACTPKVNTAWHCQSHNDPHQPCIALILYPQPVRSPV
jgi:5,10-methylene-tetrahydrofolate dehydrogenase/methenyl tetrahydrofolate cyclohydrolase